MAKVCGARFLGFLTLLFIIYNFDYCAATELEESEHYNVHSQLPHFDGSYSEIIKLRHKRQTIKDFKNQYESVPQNATDTKAIQTSSAAAAAAAVSSNGTTTVTTNSGEVAINATQTSSVVVPFNESGRLLGVNGTGQLKDSASNAQAPMPIATDDITNGVKKLLGAVASSSSSSSSSSDETSQEKVFDNIDVTDEETVKGLINRNLTVNQTTDYHNYYNSSLYVDKIEADKMWETAKNITHNSMLSQSHRRAMTVELSFDFPFYGHPVRNVTVATGGFLYTGEYVHSWLAATQYVAPLMANFDTSLANDSFVRLNDNGTALTVIWENVSLQDKQEVGRFTFSTTLHKSGDIVFTYFKVPLPIHAIQDDKHPVKVGLSDAYIIDKVVYFARRKTIYEYHRVNFASSDITNSTIIYLKALPTCLSYADCASCINHDTSFDCTWCPILNRCSTGTDRRKQEWLHKGCDKTQISDITTCPALGQKGNNANQTSSSAPTVSPNKNSEQKHDDMSMHEIYPNDKEQSIKPENLDALNKAANAAATAEHNEPKSVGLAFGFLVPLCLVCTMLLWVLYAYRNPHTKSGQLLIQYRPTQWSWRRGEARYTAATIHM